MVIYTEQLSGFSENIMVRIDGILLGFTMKNSIGFILCTFEGLV